jgi:hypothetical protein
MRKLFALSTVAHDYKEKWCAIIVFTQGLSTLIVCELFRCFLFQTFYEMQIRREQFVSITDKVISFLTILGVFQFIVQL